jgi:predicted secreted Zn-dependent protease
MWSGLRSFVLGALLAAAPAHADWQAVEKKEPYAIQGSTGIELYRSIGERGPKVGIGRAIAYTTFDLKWSRKYVPENGGCTLASAKPHLTVIYKLPKPAKKLAPATQALWDTFIAGIEAHERVHGQYILEMVKAIEAVSVGLTVADDPGCKKIRVELTAKLKALSEEQRRRGREFDKLEMSQGGNVHRLILALVNG